MATIIKRSNKYQVQIRRKGFPTTCRSFHRKADAEEWARYMDLKADRGDLPVSVKILDQFTVKGLLERYRDTVTIKKRSADTETYILNAFMRHPIANLSLAQINTFHFVTYREQRLKLVKAGTVNRELFIIKHAFDVAKKEWEIPVKKNPLGDIKKLKVNNSRSRRLLDEEYIRLINGCKKTRNPYISHLINFALCTAMRRGEILSIEWSDIDWHKNTLHIPVTKNGYARTIPLSRSALGVLNTLKNLSQDSKVFPLTANSVKCAWKRLIARSNIQDLHFHDLRHEAISRFFEHGLSVPEVALISGHRDYRMLFRYTHLRAEEVVKSLK